MFLNYTPLNSNNLNDVYSPDNIRSYYNQYGVDADNDFMKKYLGLDTTPEIKTEETNTPKRTVSDVISGITMPSQIVPEQITPVTNTPVKQNAVQQPVTSTVKVKSGSVPKSKKDFIRMYGSTARNAAKSTGLSEDMMLAQIALETGWGKSAPGYNIGGIKADSRWKGKSRLLTTKEDRKNGLQTEKHKFRVYDSPEEGFQGYVQFLQQNKRYRPLFGVSDPYAAADIMGRSGYATDRNYTSKLKNMIKQIQNTKANMT